MRHIKPPIGAFRVKRRFLLMPKAIGNDVRWLEWACWKEKYLDKPLYDGWTDACWIIETEYGELARLGGGPG